MSTLAKVAAMVAVATGVGRTRPGPAVPVAATLAAAMAARRKRSTMPRQSCPAGRLVVLGPTTLAAGRARPRRATGAGKA